MKTDWKEGLWVLARVAAGAIFAYAGLMKLLEPAANFEAALLKYGILSPHWIPWIARILPWVEWVVGGFLIFGYFTRGAAGAGSLICLLFLVTLGSSRLFLESGGSDCGCFGASGLRLSVRQIFWIDLLNLAVLLRWFFRKTMPWTLDSLLLKGKGEGDDKLKTETGQKK